MPSWTEFVCFGVDSALFAKLLNKPDSTSLVDILRDACKQTAVSKRRFEKKLEEHLPWLEKIIARVPAKEFDPVSEIDDNQVFESELYLEAFTWMCEQLGTQLPVPGDFYVNSIVIYDYFGYTEALSRFACPFPLPILEDSGMRAGFIPREHLIDFKFKSITKKRQKEIELALKELHSLAEAADEEAGELAGYLAEKLGQVSEQPAPEEIEYAHEDLSEIFSDAHKLGLDFVGMIRQRG